MKGLEHLSCEGGLRAGTAQHGEGSGRITSICINAQRKESDPFSVMLSARRRDSGHKLEHRRFPLNVREGDRALLPKKVVGSLP